MEEEKLILLLGGEECIRGREKGGEAKGGRVAKGLEVKGREDGGEAKATMVEKEGSWREPVEPEFGMEAEEDEIFDGKLLEMAVSWVDLA